MKIKKTAKKTVAPGKAEAQRNIREKNASAAVDKAELITSDKAKADGKVEILPPLTEIQKQAKATEDDKRFRELEQATNRNFIEMGMVLREMQAYDLHKYLTNKQGKKFGSFDMWLKEAAPLSRASGYAALRVANKLLPLIPQKELEQMPRYSSELLAKLPKVHLENPVIRAAARTQSKKELVSTIQKAAPDAHIEGKKKIVIQVDDSSAPIITDAFEAAVALGDIDEKEALEYICTSWMDSLCEIEAYQGMSNRQAFNAYKQARDANATAAELGDIDKDQEESPAPAEASGDQTAA